MRNTLGQSMKIVGKNALALTSFVSLIGVEALNTHFGRHLMAEIAATKAEIALAYEKIESLRRETESVKRETLSKIKEAQSASERLAIEYQLKYKHSEEYVSLQKPERTRTATSLD